MEATDRPGVSGDGAVSTGRGLGRAAAIVLPAWVLTLGVDLFLHACVLAEFYVRDIPFLVDPVTAFRRVPAGYLSFLVLTAALYWLLARSGIRGAGTGFRWGAIAGLTVWGALVLGLWSVTTAPAGLLLGWWIGQGLELGLAGAVLAAGIGGSSLRRVWGVVGIVVVILVVLVIVLQSIGLAPAVKAA